MGIQSHIRPCRRPTLHPRKAVASRVRLTDEITGRFEPALDVAPSRFQRGSHKMEARRVYHVPASSFAHIAIFVPHRAG